MPETTTIREEVQTNSKRTYYLRYLSRLRFAFVFMPLSLGLTGILVVLRQQGVFLESKWIVLVLIMFLLAITYYLSHRVATANVTITLDGEGAHQAWLTQFAFASNPDITIRWTDIVDYKFELEPNNHWFKATLKDGTIWRFHRDLYSFKKDDFSIFSTAFAEKVAQYNLENDVNGVSIRRAKTFPETHAAHVLAIFITVLMAAFPIVLVVLFSNNSPATNLVGIFGAVAFVPAFLFVYFVHLMRKERHQ